MKKTLYSFYEELKSMYFDKRKVQGLVKRANAAGYDIYYAYHEDGPDTWRHRWSVDNYRHDCEDVRLVTSTNLIGKRKPSISFTKAKTYTAECAIFVFCPLKTLLADPDLRNIQIERERAIAERNAIERYNQAIASKAELDKWEQLPASNKSDIERLQKEIEANLAQPKSRKIRLEKEKQISDLGGKKPFGLVDWQKEALSFPTLDEYIFFSPKQGS